MQSKSRSSPPPPPPPLILKTHKMREAEEAARRAKVTKAVIRVHFPDKYVLEAKFQPSETLQSLMDLLKKVVARPDLPLYIYLEFDNSKGGPYLRDDILFLNGLDLPIDRVDHVHPEEEPKGVQIPSPVPVPDPKPPAKKPAKPKWLKL